MENTSLVQRSELNILSVSSMQLLHNAIVDFKMNALVSGQDYGVIPGVAKPSLLKSGAEKLRRFFNLQPFISGKEDLSSRSDLYLDFTYKVSIKDANGFHLSECEGNCNSDEPKFKYIWVPEHEVPKDLDKSTLKKKGSSIVEFEFAINKAETGGKYGKPADYWQKFKDAIASGKAKSISKATSSGKSMPAWEISSCSYRIPNPDVMGMKNTLMKMAQKRAFVGAVLMATGASEFFTHDVEDMEILVESHNSNFIDVEFAEVSGVSIPTDEEKALARLKNCFSLDDLRVIRSDFEHLNKTSKKYADAFKNKYQELSATEEKENSDNLIEALNAVKDCSSLPELETIKNTYSTKDKSYLDAIEEKGKELLFDNFISDLCSLSVNSVAAAADVLADKKYKVLADDFVYSAKMELFYNEKIPSIKKAEAEQKERKAKRAAEQAKKISSDDKEVIGV